ncbi:MAG TPA: hypothetical protein VL485_02475 [Ktedonobacteraceae bacterium]|nr:hypothetical protein [Ktedonobacteraceae bacterium]
MMNLTSLQVTLLIGKFIPLPAPPPLMEALQTIDITQSESSGFQISFLAQRGPGYSPDYPLLISQLLQPGNRVIIIVTLNVIPRVLMDGIITHQQFAPGNNGPATLTVTGEDISVAMNMSEVSIDYPNLGHAAIATLVLEKYAGLGIEPIIIPPLTGSIPDSEEFVLTQRGTDRSYLQSLAAANDYIFYVRPGLLPGQNIAYWGPITRIGLPQKALTVDAGPATNVESISFSYDGLAPVQVYGAVSDEETEQVIPFVTLTSSRLPPLSSLPPLIFNQPFVRKQELAYEGSSFLEAEALAQAITDQSLDSVVTANGTLDVLRYGDILMAPGLVGVRGVGFSYDGYYVVKQVSHQISHGKYTQSFNLSREGLGSTTPLVSTIGVW